MAPMFRWPGANLSLSDTAFWNWASARAAVVQLQVDHPQVVVDARILVIELARVGADELGEPVVALVVVDEREVLVGVGVVLGARQHPARGGLGLVELLRQPVGHGEVVEQRDVVLVRPAAFSASS